MKLLLDSCVWAGARDQLTATGHDVVWVGDWPEDPGDEEILELALREARILVTLDKDFGELAVVRGKRHSGILRLVNFSSAQQGVACVAILEHYAGDLELGAIITAEPGRLRIRPSEQE